jgi:hypothetical protein
LTTTTFFRIYPAKAKDFFVQGDTLLFRGVYPCRRNEADLKFTEIDTEFFSRQMLLKQLNARINNSSGGISSACGTPADFNDFNNKFG